ncbi:MAG: heme-binding domain-containing protein [Bacteroidetes bacterium]|nr:heme-binding domain-containing protein [Bacteroidota bacterium]
MKKSLWITLGVICFVILASLVINRITAQPAPKEGEKSKPIPANVMKIADKSCVKCHTEPGDFMALSHLNLSNWDKYSPEKQAAKAKDMCSMVTKDKMPPKKFRTNHPGDVPDAAELNTLCNWAQSIQVSKK